MLVVARFLYNVKVCIGVNMTGTRTIAKFANRVLDIGIFGLFVRPRFVVVGMATGAGPWIVEGITNVFVIALVAGNTANVSSMVARVITIV